MNVARLLIRSFSLETCAAHITHEGNLATLLIDAHGTPGIFDFRLAVVALGTCRKWGASLHYIASRFEPRLASLAGEPLLGLCFAVKANNVLLLPAKGVCRHKGPRCTHQNRPGVKGDLIGRVCHRRHR